MGKMLPFILLILGIVFLVMGADRVVEAAKKLSLKFHVSHAFIGLTIISIGTSLPEIFTNVFSGIKTLEGIEASGIAVGTNIGSCLSQITLVLGLTALLGTMHITRKALFRDGFMILFSIALMFIFGLDGSVSRIEGVFLLGGYMIYLYILSRHHDVVKNVSSEIRSKKQKHKEINILKNMVYITIGIVLLVVGSDLVVNNALKISEMFGLAQSFVGVMIVGVGGALPELSTAIKGVLKKAQGISLGTLMGSNVTDPMFSLGSGALISGFSFAKNLLFFDLPFWFFATIAALVLIRKDMGIGKKDRWKGIILLALYAVFVVLKISFFM